MNPYIRPDSQFFFAGNSTVFHQSTDKDGTKILERCEVVRWNIPMTSIPDMITPQESDNATTA